jgi:2-polyprenyl-3-methyl-5-hydroxy-6-metoxy-1,4-benzoquinol methylase
MNEEERMEKALMKALIGGTPEDIVNALAAVWIAYPTKERTIAAARVMATYNLVLGNYLRTINICMDARDMLDGMFDMQLLMCVKMANTALASVYSKKTGKSLSSYNFELIYTTEDEFDNGFELSRDFKEDPSEGDKAVAKQLHGNILRNWEPYTRLTDDTWEQHQNAFDSIYSVLYEAVEFNDGDRILDLGCGTMANPLKLLSDYGTKDYELIGMDVRGHTLLATRKFINQHFPEVNYTIIRADAVTAIPSWFKEKEFHVVTTFDFIEHIRKEEYLTLLRCVHHVLKDGGRFYISKPNGLRFLGGVEEKDAGEHVSEKSVGYLRKTLYDAGFSTKVLCRQRILIEAIKKEKK